MSKRKRVVLNFQQKLDILRQLQEGKSGAVLAKEYGIGTSTISDMKRNADAILQFVSNLDCQIAEKKTRKTAQNTDLDSKIYKWYLEEKEKGVTPFDAAICAKALEINETLSNANQNFKASPGWLKHFKNRHGIHHVEKEVEDPQEASTVARHFRNMMKRGGYTLENVYNADEVVLDWKSLPNDGTSGTTVTVFLCANANASHKLPLWVIGQGTEVFPDESVIYKHQPSIRVTRQVFEDWFENHFVPEVLKRQESTGNVGKVLLVVDDAPWHFSFEVPSKYQNQINVFFLKNDLVQPSEVEMRRRFKMAYRKKLLQTVDEVPLKHFFQEFTLNDSIYLIGEAWNAVSKRSIARSWRQLFADSSKNNEDADSGDEEMSEIFSLARGVDGLDVGDDDISQWLDGDNDYNLYADDDTDFVLTEEIIEGPSHMEVYQCLDTVTQWLKKQQECTRDQLACLETLSDLAASKICGQIKEEKD